MTGKTCDQCEAVCINGIFCHETGCPNARKTWVPERGWIRFLECRECGCEIEEGEYCNCFEFEEINWEDSTLVCAHSGEKIESAYGEEESDSCES